MKRFLAIFLCLVMLTSTFSLVLADGITPGENETPGEEWGDFTVTFVDWDGTVLKEVKVYEGEDATPPEDPTREADENYAYEFAGWEGDYTNVQADITITATYNQIEKPTYFTITFVDEDGSELQSSEVAEGDTPEYTGETPTKAADAQYTYTFAGWTPEIAAVTGDATYTATYTATVNKYLVKFVDEDGTELQSSEVEYGTVPTAPADPTKAEDETYTYEFAGWTPEIVAVTGEATYKATYKATAKPTEPDDEAIPGDANGDGKFNAQDITLANQAYVGGYGITIDEDAFDVNNDGKFNAQDITLAKQAYVGGYGVELV